MQANSTLAKLHQQFQKKHLELSQITLKIDQFMHYYKIKNKQDCDKTSHLEKIEKQIFQQNKTKIRDRFRLLRDELGVIRGQFYTIKQDLFTYSQLPSQFVRMVIELPGLYETHWEKRQQEFIRNLEVKDQQCKFYKQKLHEKQLEIIQLNKKLVFQNQLNKQLSNKLKSKLSPATEKQQQKNIQTTSNNYNNKINQNKFCVKDELKVTQSNRLSNRLNIKPNLTLKQAQEEQDLDAYIENMEITIRQSDDVLFKKITEHDSQQQQESMQNQNLYINGRLNNTARPALLLDLQNSLQFAKEVQKRKKSETSFINQLKQTNSKKKLSLKAADEFINKNLFWNKMTKNSQQPKHKNRKSLSQSKQNIDNRQSCKFTAVQKKILTSKITDFRKILFAEKGLQRIGLKM